MRLTAVKSIVLLCIAITSTLTQPVHADIKNIKVATFNVKLMPAFYDGWSSYQGEGLPRVDYVQRINVMTNIAKSTFRWETKVYAEADVVTEADIEAEAETRFGFDVIAYQEVWRNIIPYHVHFANIRDRLISIGFERENIVRGITSIERGWHHGLVIASRFPVVEKAEMIFSNSAGAEFWVQKGALFAKIDVEGRHVAVFNTHLQADTETEDYSHIRKLQLKQLRAFIEKHARQVSAVIVLGDFNIEKGDFRVNDNNSDSENTSSPIDCYDGVGDAACRLRVCEDDNSTEYCQWFTNSGEYGNWSNFIDNAPENSTGKLDYILTKSPYHARAASRTGIGDIYNFGGGVPTLSSGSSGRPYGVISDHPAVFGEFSIQRGPIYSCYNGDGIKGTVAGDFNGDGVDDIATTHRQASKATRTHVFLSNSSRFDFQGIAGWWNHNWYEANAIKGIVAGDFNGDGKHDIAQAYDYGKKITRAHVLLSNGRGFDYQGNRGWWSHSWYEGKAIKGMVSGDFNADGKYDIAMAYDYGRNKIRVHVLLSNGSRFNYQGDSGWWNHSWYEGKAIKGMVSADFNGDSKDDIAMTYDYGKNNTRAHVLLSNGNRFNYQGDSGWWNHNWYEGDQIRGISAGDFNNNGLGDLAIPYYYGRNRTAIHTLLSDRNSFNYQSNRGWWACM